MPAVDQDDVCVGYRRGVDGRRGEVVRIAVGGDVEGLDCAVGTDDFPGDRPQTLVEVTTSGRMTSVESDPSEHPLRTAVVVMTAAATAADRRRRWRTGSRFEAGGLDGEPLMKMVSESIARGDPIRATRLFSSP